MYHRIKFSSKLLAMDDQMSIAALAGKVVRIASTIPNLPAPVHCVGHNSLNLLDATPEKAIFAVSIPLRDIPDFLLVVNINGSIDTEGGGGAMGPKTTADQRELLVTLISLLERVFGPPASATFKPQEKGRRGKRRKTRVK